MANPFVHVELTTSDPDKAKTFYGSLFDWKLEDVEMGPGFTYTMINVGEGTGGGLMKTPAPGVPTAWLPYVLVADVAAATTKAKSLGATIMTWLPPSPKMVRINRGAMRASASLPMRMLPVADTNTTDG